MAAQFVIYFGKGDAMQLGRFGVWSHAAQLSPKICAELEQIGYSTVWIGGSPAADLAIVDELLAATTNLVIATGIVNIWTAEADEVAASYARIEQAFPSRFLLGIGTGHREQIGDNYEKPYSALVRYLDGLSSVPSDRRVLAALGPRVLELARDRTAGAHPYLTTPAHTRTARSLLGAGRLLAPEHKIVMNVDPERARAIGRPYVEKPYLGLANYVANLRRLGYTEDDLAGSGSDRLIDDLVAHGSPADISARLGEHLDAGADHVAVHVLTEGDEGILPALRALAPALF